MLKGKSIKTFLFCHSMNLSIHKIFGKYPSNLKWTEIHRNALFIVVNIFVFVNLMEVKQFFIKVYKKKYDVMIKLIK